MVTRPNWLDLERKASRREGNQLELAGVGRLVKIADLSAPGSLKSSRHCLFPIINTFSLSLCLSFFLSLSLSFSLSLFLSFFFAGFLAFDLVSQPNSLKTIAVDQKRNVFDEPIRKAVRERDYFLFRLCLNSYFGSLCFSFLGFVALTTYTIYISVFIDEIRYYSTETQISECLFILKYYINFLRCNFL